MKNLFFLFVFFLIISPATAQERLTVDGNLIKTPDGFPVTLRGVSLCSLDWHNPLALAESIFKEKWDINTLRLPVQVSEWKKSKPDEYINDRIDPAVALCKKHKIYCIIDWHDIRPWDDRSANKDLQDFWARVAPRYSNNRNIIYEIFNEPTTPKDKTVENWNNWRNQVQLWVDDIRKVAPDTLLLIGSPHWSQMTNFAADYPVRGENLAYTAHIYPNYKSHEWDSLFGDAAEKVPVFLTEWGWSESKDADNQIQGNIEEYALPLRRYLDDRPAIHWTAWSYDPKCGPAMLGNDSQMGKFVKDWLAQPHAD